MEAIVVRREPRDGMAIIEELVQVRGVTDVEGWMLRDKVAIVVGLVRAEGGWGGWEVLHWLDKLCGMELLLLLAECQGMDLWLPKADCWEYELPLQI